MNASDDPILREFVWRAIGPASMRGRVDDIEGLPTDPSTIYVGYATGGVWKTTPMGTTWTPLFDEDPVSSIGDIAISPHNPSTIYTGANRRNTLSIMGVPGDQPMASQHDGTANSGTITTLAESPSRRGLTWVGTDDGNVQVSRDGGVTWTNVAPNVPGPKGNCQVSRVEPSHVDPATCYVALDDHRNDDWNPYVFVTRDYGKTWQSIASNLPRGNVNVIREDPRNPDLLYAGTEFRWFVSLDGGRGWKRFMTGRPTVRVDDILVHPREHDLLVGTHGRSISIVDDVTALQQFRPEVAKADVHLFDIRPGTLWVTDTTLGGVNTGTKRFAAPNPPPRPPDAPPLPPGTPPPPGPLVQPRTYLVELAAAGRELVKPVIVEADRWFAK